MNLFIDIDGVLLGKDQNSNHCVLANYASEFLEFSLRHFDCYWLTTHCKGSTDTVLDYLTPYSDDNFLNLLQKVKPTYFKTFKVEALFGDYFWIDDQPTAYEIKFLEENNQLHRWLQVNTRADINELKSIMSYLRQQI